MLRLMLTLDSPAANLALDEALLDWAEDEGPEWEFLRLWESPLPMVVLGRSSRVDQEVDVPACRAGGIPIVRRSSGGAAIVAGPGCLMYAVVLSNQLRPRLRGIPEAHRYVLGRLAEALRSYVPTVQQAGTSDLALADEQASGIVYPPRDHWGGDREKVPDTVAIRKFSGNSLRVKRTHCLYHGTLLYDFDLSLTTTYLNMPPRQPEYRLARGHAEFVANLPLTGGDLQAALLEAWPTSGEVEDWPRGRVAQLVEERYSRDDWNLAYGRSGSG